MMTTGKSKVFIKSCGWLLGAIVIGLVIVYFFGEEESVSQAQASPSSRTQAKNSPTPPVRAEKPTKEERRIAPVGAWSIKVDIPPGYNYRIAVGGKHILIQTPDGRSVDNKTAESLGDDVRNSSFRYMSLEQTPVEVVTYLQLK